jgi:hypothetical protein
VNPRTGPFVTHRSMPYIIFVYKPMLTRCPLGWGQFWPKGHDLYKCCSGSQCDATCPGQSSFLKNFKSFHFLKSSLASLTYLLITEIIYIAFAEDHPSIIPDIWSNPSSGKGILKKLWTTICHLKRSPLSNAQVS